MPAKKLRRIAVQGFKSIKNTNLELGDLNVVIGANGSGKSNLIGVFHLLERILTRNLQLYVASEPDRILFHGRKHTRALKVLFDFDGNLYDFVLEPSNESLVFASEWIINENIDWNHVYRVAPSAGHKESKLEDQAKRHKEGIIVQEVFQKMRNLVVYHFHDTSNSSPAKQTADLDDNQFFRHDAANLPAYLYWLQQKHPIQFRHIEEHIQLAAPFFDRFVLNPRKLNASKIKLEWRQKNSDAYFDAWSLSDGTLRFICLATLLLQPEPPKLILLDEPELGLHPFAINILADMLEVASKSTQIIIATQSVTLLNHLSLRDIIVAENDGFETSFRRLDEEKLKEWLDAYSLGELWEKNVLGGRP